MPLIPIFLQALPYLFKAAQAIPEVVTYIKDTKAALAQTKEWTDADETTFNAHLEQVTSQPWWQE